MEVLLLIFAPIASFAGLVYVSYFSFVGGIETGETRIKDAAVKSGHAEYYLDEKMEKQWRWK